MNFLKEVIILTVLFDEYLASQQCFEKVNPVRKILDLFFELQRKPCRRSHPLQKS
jgi:hypothetical protein